MIERYRISIFDTFAIASCHAVQRKGRPEKERQLSLLHSHHVLILLLHKCTNCSKSLGIHGGAVCTFKWAPGPFLPLFIAKFWSRYNTFIPTPNQSSSPLWIAASTPDIVPAIPCPLVKRLQPLHQSLCNVWSPPGQSWWSSGGSAFKISALA